MGIVQTDPHVVIMCQAKDHSLYFFDSDSVVQRADVVGADGHQGIVAVSIDTAGKQHIITTGDKHPDKCVWLFKDGPY